MRQLLQAAILCLMRYRRDSDWKPGKICTFVKTVTLLMLGTTPYGTSI